MGCFRRGVLACIACASDYCNAIDTRNCVHNKRMEGPNLAHSLDAYVAHSTKILMCQDQLSLSEFWVRILSQKKLRLRVANKNVPASAKQRIHNPVFNFTGHGTRAVSFRIVSDTDTSRGTPQTMRMSEPLRRLAVSDIIYRRIWDGVYIPMIHAHPLSYNWTPYRATMQARNVIFQVGASQSIALSHNYRLHTGRWLNLEQFFMNAKSIL